MIKNKTIKILFIFLAVLALVSIVYLISVSNNKPSLVVTKTTPTNNATGIPITTSVVNISFDKSLSEKDSKKITYTVQPEMVSESLILNDQMTIAFKEKLQKGATYTVDLKYDNKQIYELKFETELFTQEQIEKEGSLQSQADINFNNSYQNFIQQNPWYLKIPIENKDYRIVYDFDKKMFRIRILSTTVTGDQIKVFTQEGLNDLKKIGVAEPIKYYVLDANGNQL